MPADLSGPAVAVGCGATARRVRGDLERRKRRPVACVSFVFQLGVPGIFMLHGVHGVGDTLPLRGVPLRLSFKEYHKQAHEQRE